MAIAKPLPGSLPDSWRVCLPVFEGPLDLLLHLVKINRVEIADIPVVQICDQFHEYLALMEELDLDIAGEYVYEASLLIQIKSRLLLPRPKSQAGEPEEDPRQELVQRLLEYRRIKEAAQALAEVHSLRRGVWTRPRLDLRELAGEDASDDEGPAQIELGEVSLFDLLQALEGVLDRYDREHPLPLVLRGESFAVRDQLLRMSRRMEGGRPLELVDDLRERSCRAEAIAAFLAVLEMAKLGLVRLHQGDGGTILLYRTSRELRLEELEGLDA